MGFMQEFTCIVRKRRRQCMLLSCIQHPQSKANIYLRISGIIPTFEKKKKEKRNPLISRDLDQSISNFCRHCPHELCFFFLTKCSITKLNSSQGYLYHLAYALLIKVGINSPKEEEEEEKKEQTPKIGAKEIYHICRFCPLCVYMYMCAP